MKRLSAPITALVVLLLTTLAWADALPSAKPEQVGLSSERLARVTQVLKAEIAKGQYPGAVVLVARKGRIAYFEGLGERDPAAGASLQTDSIDQLYSMSKPVTTVSAMRPRE